MDATELAFAGIARQAELIAAGEVSARELLEVYLERIERIDPRLNAFRVVLARQARGEAEHAHERHAAGESLPLLGVPIAIKDDVEVAGEVTAWGTRAHGPPARSDAEVVRRLRAAGAVIIGKTNVPELTQWPFTETPTWGVTRNPWDLGHTPGGSSGGSAAAVAAGLVGGALGSDGAGSIRIPAAWCGLFGLKPERGRISLMPRPEAWHGLSVNGPITRSVRDAALFMDVTAGAAAGDRDTPPPPPRPYLEAAASAPQRLTIAVSMKFPPGLIGRADREQREATERTAELLRSLGHEVERRDPDYGMSISTNLIPRYARGIHDDGHGLPHPELLERRTRAMMRLGALTSTRRLAKVRAGEARLDARLGRLFADHDVLLTPATAKLAPKLGRLQHRGALWTLNTVAGWVPYNGIWNATGQPAVAVPAGFSSVGLPLSVQIVGRHNAEDTLLSLAAQIEAERPWAHSRPPLD